MFTPFTGRHVGGPRKSSNMAAPYKADYNFACNISKNSSNLRQCTHLKLWELSSLPLPLPLPLPSLSQFLDFIHCMVFEFIFYCVTTHTRYILKMVYCIKCTHVLALNLYLALLRSKSLDTIGLAGLESSHLLA